MTQVNMFEAKTELSKLVRMLETKQEDKIIIARNGIPVAQIVLLPQERSGRLGAAAGVFTVPDEFDDWDKEIEDMFGGEL